MSKDKGTPENDPAVKLLKAACRKEQAKLKGKDPFTDKQTAAIKTLFDRNPDGADTLKEFEDRFNHCIGGYVGGQWCNQHIGIESDGYTHT